MTTSTQKAADDDSAGRAGAAEQQGEALRQLAGEVEEMPPAEAARALAELPPARAAELAEFLDPRTVAQALAEMPPEAAAALVGDMAAPEAAVALAAMHPDDRVDVLGHVAPPLHEALLAEMEAADAADVRRLEQYPPDTAGGIMTTEVVALPEHLTVEQAIVELRRLNKRQEQMFYVYVVDPRGRLSGVLSTRDMILADPDTPLSRIVRPDVVTVPPTMDQEQVARRMSENGFLALPVVDDRRHLLGLITIDDVLDVLQEEATEDVQVMFGAGAEERLTSPWTYSFRRRLPWLQVNLLTAFLAASVVGFFEATIAEAAILAMYMPIVAGMGGNASAQAMAVAIRGIALGEVDRRLLAAVLRRELIVGVLSGLCVGLSAVVLAALFHREYGIVLGVLAGLALVVNHTLACVWGVAVPFVMKRLGFDPAQSATIFTTTLTDMVGFFTLLGLASAWMAWLK